MYHVKWIVQDRILLVRAVGDQTLDTFEDGVQRAMKYIDAGDPPVHVINDSRYLGKFPLNIKSLQTALKLNQNSGQTISIGGDGMVKFTTTILAKVAGMSIEFQNSVDGAITYLQRADLSLPRDIEYQDTPPDEVGS